ncbi:alanine/glycine:cation symporter family protein [Mycobacterium xenopi]|uniref:Sodium:alanine symporter n=1 Tax=Mycobacterium xenopi TaxID=1789 RepID=A0AAD1H2N3_MYCXE|nr:alanine/glycine:cation symporter family protein [Mycobacterium xenopi]MDA3639844.1 alanine/glycine:cation symporter family protein [Mycobacterium xenopi]MDA3658204.1 alanine/glycine:cation symporter family protein [Mycobacterium xenopi]MDA3661856.1 alanine/glycine:cation symporter family protein [Mycobacterium xenopi]SPX88939.1 amino acid carrier protein [Mycobacterium xenopi]BBU23291.1 sodium:alanine symporter [Mycobacterium xenopi]
MDFLRSQLIDPVGQVLCAYVLVYLLIGTGIYLTVRTRFVQVRYFGRMIRQLRVSRRHGVGISSFQAFCVGLAARVGVGNIAGVAIALTVGGPGAIFWMWVAAGVGMATALIEATLAQVFKVRCGDGTFRGGPAFYIQRGLGSQAGSVLFAVLLVFTFGVAFNMVEANAISDVLKISHHVGVGWTAVILVALTAPIVFGGVRSVARVAGVVLPVVAMAYALLALVIVLVHIRNLPGVFHEIIGGAFGIPQMAGGFGGGLAVAMLNGVKRGLFANEAGMGSTPNVAATATVSHPVEQGLIQSLGVFVDTMVICTATALVVLVSGPAVYDPAHAGAVVGASLTQSAVAAGLGSWTTGLMSVVVFVFGFSSVLGDYVCAEANLLFLGGRQRAINLLKISTLVAVALGAIAKLALVWALADVGMALIAIVNLVAICLLSKWAFAVLNDFHRQSQRGARPVFVADEADLPGVLSGEIWQRPAYPADRDPRRRLPWLGAVTNDTGSHPESVNRSSSADVAAVGQ